MIVSMTEETCCVALEKCEYHAGRRVELFGHAQRSVCAVVSHVIHIVYRTKVLAVRTSPLCISLQHCHCHLSQTILLYESVAPCWGDDVGPAAMCSARYRRYALRCCSCVTTSAQILCRRAVSRIGCSDVARLL
eukprot:COSAG01_NODE_16338_length_1244_cov_24.179039_1_plen_134_part_00